MTRLAAAATVFVLLVGPACAGAQGRWTVTPSLGVTEEFDDNLFGTASHRRSDFITRFTPGLALDHAGPAFRLGATYALDAEIYADHSQLDNVGDRQRARLDLSYQVDPRLGLSLTGFLTRTQTTSDFLLPQAAPTTTTAGAAPAPAPSTGAEGAPGTTGTTGVDVGRRQTTAYGVSPALAYQLTPTMSTTASYAYARNEGSGAGNNASHTLSVAPSSQLSPEDTGTLRYSGSYFEGDQVDSHTSHSATVGWSRRVTALTVVSLEAGPRITGGSLGVDARASLTHRFQQGLLSLGYSHGESLVVGRAGSSTVDTGTAAVSFQPLRDLVAGLSGSISRVSPESEPTGPEPRVRTPDTTTYGASAFASYRATQWLSASLNYQFSHQEQGRETINHHRVAVTLNFSYDFPFD